MKGLKQFGAIALAAAMTITLAVPARVNAFYADTDYNVEYTKNADGEITSSTSKGYTDKNKVTGDTYSWDSSTYKSTGDYYKANYYNNGIRKQAIIGTNDYGHITFTLDPGSEVTKVKVSKGKKNITITQSGISSNTTTPDWDDEAKKYYFRKVNGDKEYISLAQNHTGAEYEAAKRTQNSYTYRVYGKKNGTSEVKFTIKDAAGASKTTKVKVTVSEESRRITQITYAGKALKLNYNKGANNDKYYACQSADKSGNFFVTKKSGKLKVSMGKNFKFIAAYVITPNAYETKTTSWDDSEAGYVDKYSKTYAKRKYSYGIDLNNDGDYADTIDGISEDGYKNCSFQKVKNNKKIKLNTVPDKTDSTTTNTYGDQGQYTSTEKEVSNSNMATTQIIIVYQDKLTKEFNTEKLDITLRVGKK